MSLIDGIRKLIHATEARSYESRVAQWMDELGGSAGTNTELPHVIRRDVVVVADLGGVPGDRRVRLSATVAVPPGSIDVPAVQEALERAQADGNTCLLTCDGDRVVCLTDLAVDKWTLHRMIDLVVCAARYDGGLTETLLSLPSATPLIGVRKHTQCVAQIEGSDFEDTPEARRWAQRAGDGALVVKPSRARFTWAGVERDRERLHAGVKALRSLRRVTGPYR